MRQTASIAGAALLTLATLAAQAPPGWRVRVDRSTSASDPDAPGALSLTTSGSGLHAVNPQASVYWNPASTAQGTYIVGGTFTLLEPSNHTNYYGLVFGGRDLEGPSQRYAYFLVAQDGTWLVKRRAGDETTDTLLPKTASGAVRTPDATGRSTNRLEVRVSPAAIDFVVNGTTVNTWSGAGRLVDADGIYGIRVNHFLNVQVDAFGLVSSDGAATTTTGGPAVAKPETVAVTAAVARQLSPTAFALQRGAGAPLLVLAPSLQRPPEPASVATVVGRQVPFSAEAVGRVARDYRLDLPPAAAADFRGAPAIVAGTVLDARLIDLTKRPAPPETPDEASLDALMKRVAPAFAALRAAVDQSKGTAAVESAAALEQALGEVHAFWTARGRTDAVGWASSARSAAQDVGRAAAAGSWERAKASAGTLGQQCQACHNAYRQQFGDGVFRIKRG
jgi:hypothetical protein